MTNYPVEKTGKSCQIEIVELVQERSSLEVRIALGTRYLALVKAIPEWNGQSGTYSYALPGYYSRQRTPPLPGEKIVVSEQDLTPVSIIKV